MDVPKTILCATKAGHMVDRSDITLDCSQLDWSQLEEPEQRRRHSHETDTTYATCESSILSHQRWQAEPTSSSALETPMPRRRVPTRTRSSIDVPPKLPSKGERSVRRNNSWRPPRYPQRTSLAMVSPTPKAA